MSDRQGAPWALARASLAWAAAVAAVACGPGTSDAPSASVAGAQSDSVVSHAAPGLAATQLIGAQAVASSQPVRIGRFTYAVPAGTQASLQLAELEGVAISPMEPDGDSTPAQRWAAHVAEIVAGHDAAPSPGAPSIVLEQRTIAPGVPLVLLRPNSATPQSRTAEAMIDRGPASLWLRRVYRPGQETQVASTMETLARAYRRLDAGPGEPAPTQGFFVPGAVFARPPVVGEVSGAVLRYPTEAALDAVVVRTGRNPRLDEERELIAAWRARAADPALREPDTEVTLVRLGPRTVAGLDGEEALVRLTQDGGAAVLALEWEYHGGGAQPLRPFVRLAATANFADKVRAVAEWNQLLAGTLRTEGPDRPARR